MYHQGHCGLGAERKAGKGRDGERLPYLYKAMRARNERIGEFPEAQPLPLASCFDAHPQLPGCLRLVSQEQQALGRGLDVYLETRVGEVGFWGLFLADI